MCILIVLLYRQLEQQLGDAGFEAFQFSLHDGGERNRQQSFFFIVEKVSTVEANRLFNKLTAVFVIFYYEDGIDQFNGGWTQPNMILFFCFVFFFNNMNSSIVAGPCQNR